MGVPGPQTAAPVQAVLRSEDERARKKRHPRDIRNDDEAKAYGGGRPPFS